MRIKGILQPLVLVAVFILAGWGIAHATSTFITQQGGTGTSSPSGILSGDNGASGALHTVSYSGCSFNTATFTLTCSGTGSPFPFTPTGSYVATSTTIGFLNGLFSTASSTFSNNLFLSSLSAGGLGVGTNGLVYSGATTTAGTGLTYSGNAFSVNTSQNISTLSNLTGNGFVKTSGGTGALSIDTNTYLTSAVTSLAQTSGSAQTGALTIGSSTTAINNDWGITNIAGAFTFNIPTATSAIRGLLSAADWTAFNAKQAAGNYITALTGDVTASGPGSVAATIAANAVTYAKFQQVAANSLVGNPTGALANAQAIATSTLGIALSDTTGTLATSRGGTGTTTVRTGGLFFGASSLITQATQVGNDIIDWTSSKLGIGTSTPWAQVSVNPNGIGTGPTFAIGSSTAPLFNISNIGMVGIGTTTPSNTLSLDRNTTIASSSILVTEYKYGKTGNIATSTAQTIDCRTSNQHHWRLGAAATTITMTGFQAGQKCIVVIENPNGTAGALTWAVASGYELFWPVGIIPTQTTTANKQDVWSFLATEASSSISVLGAQSANF